MQFSWDLRIDEAREGQTNRKPHPDERDAGDLQDVLEVRDLDHSNLG